MFIGEEMRSEEIIREVCFEKTSSLLENVQSTWNVYKDNRKGGVSKFIESISNFVENFLNRNPTLEDTLKNAISEGTDGNVVLEKKVGKWVLTPVMKEVEVKV